MILAIAATIMLVGMLCVVVYVAAIYALPILVALAVYALGQSLGMTVPVAVIASAAFAMLALAIVRAGMASSSLAIRIAVRAVITAPAAYAGYAVTTQLLQLLNASQDWRVLIACAAALVVANFSIKFVGRLDRVPPLRSLDLSKVRLPAHLRRSRSRAQSLEKLRHSFGPRSFDKPSTEGPAFSDHVRKFKQARFARQALTWKTSREQAPIAPDLTDSRT